MARWTVGTPATCSLLYQTPSLDPVGPFQFGRTSGGRAAPSRPDGMRETPPAGPASAGAPNVRLGSSASIS